MALTPEGTPYVEASDLVANYPAASLALANRVDLVGVLPFATSAARATAIPSPTDGQFSYLRDSDSTQFYNGTAWSNVAVNKILQVVRATDSTTRSTTSLSFVDVTGMSVAITPQRSTSAVLLIMTGWAVITSTSGSQVWGEYQITDNSNNAISGAQGTRLGTVSFSYTSTGEFYSPMMLVGYATPATTSPVTYKLRFKTNSATATNIIVNATNTGQMYAIEVGA